MSQWNDISRQALAGTPAKPEQAMAVLESTDDELLAVLDAAFAVRRARFGRGVRLHVIRNARSGLCTEDCAYCSQSAKSDAAIQTYPLQAIEDIVQGAKEASAMKAVRYCIVTSGRETSARDEEMLCEAVRRIKREVPLQICTSLGMLDAKRARRLKEAGVDRYNHNLETSERFYPTICSTHTWADRRATARVVKAVGMELCSGGLMGMGESLGDRVDLAIALHDVGADSIPLNFLDPRPGTPLEGLARMKPADCLRALAMFRFVNPDREIRLAGGREACLGPLQPLCLYAANSIFTSGYLTTPGQGYQADLAMIEAAGFYVTEITDA